MLVLLLNVYTSLDFTFEEEVKFATLSVIGLGFLFGIFQLIANHDWNRRNAALLETEKNKDRYLESLKYLYSVDCLGIEHRTYAYSVEEIHKCFCVLDNTNIKLLPKNTSTNEYEMTEDGKKIRQNLFNVLNYFEFLAAGVNHKVFDENIIKDLQYSIMMRFYTLFIEYIKHYRDAHSRGSRVSEQYITLIEKWEEDKKKTWRKVQNLFGFNKRNGTDS